MLSKKNLKSRSSEMRFPAFWASKTEGGVGIFGSEDLANFWFGFSVFTLKNCSFPVLVFCSVCRFSPILALVFGFLHQWWRFLGFFCPMHFMVFLVLPRKFTSQSHYWNCNSNGPQLELEECMKIQFPLVIWVLTAAKLPGGGTWVNFCWVCAAGLSEPLPHYSLFCGQL